MSVEFKALLKKISHDIVSKSRRHHIIAEELRKLSKHLHTATVVRWNSILFMIRSVLKLTDEDLKMIRDKLPKKNKHQRLVKKFFSLSAKERAMLQELCQVLTWFEFVTDQLQGNTVTISRVYPCIRMLMRNLNETDNMAAKYTSSIRQELRLSLIKRFGYMVQRDVCVISTFLDPQFGLTAFEKEKQAQVKGEFFYYIL